MVQGNLGFMINGYYEEKWRILLEQEKTSRYETRFNFILSAHRVSE